VNPLATRYTVKSVIKVPLIKKTAKIDFQPRYDARSTINMCSASSGGKTSEL
jgi:hypothetical protein